MKPKTIEELKQMMINANNPKERLDIAKRANNKLSDEALCNISGGACKDDGEYTPAELEAILGDQALECPKCFPEHHCKTGSSLEMFGQGTFGCYWCGYMYNYVAGEAPDLSKWTL